jgi:hypothetical protein
MVSAPGAARLRFQGGGHRWRLCDRSRTHELLHAQRPARRPLRHGSRHADLERGLCPDLPVRHADQERRLSQLLQSSVGTDLARLRDRLQLRPGLGSGGVRRRSRRYRPGAFRLADALGRNRPGRGGYRLYHLRQRRRGAVVQIRLDLPLHDLCDLRRPLDQPVWQPNPCRARCADTRRRTGCPAG